MAHRPVPPGISQGFLPIAPSDGAPPMKCRTLHSVRTQRNNNKKNGMPRHQKYIGHSYLLPHLSAHRSGGGSWYGGALGGLGLESFAAMQAVAVPRCNLAPLFRITTRSKRKDPHSGFFPS
ncbi:hypothetical protein VTO42DRAFT_2225 [Malbranchea cinnamomea]